MMAVYSIKWTCILLISANVYLCKSASVTSPGVISAKIGKISTVITCDVSDSSGGGNWTKLYLYRADSDLEAYWTLLLELDFHTQFIHMGKNDKYELKNRTEHMFANDTYKMTLTYQEVRCTDAGVYYCIGLYDAEVAIKHRSRTVLEVLVPPDLHSRVDMTASPADLKLQVFTDAIFTCKGNVGGPIGWFWWFVAKGDLLTDVTNQSSVEEAHNSTSPCTIVVLSKLVLEIREQYEGSTVRCIAYQPDYAAPPTECQILCAESRVISVFGTEHPERLSVKMLASVVSLATAQFAVLALIIRLCYKWIRIQLSKGDPPKDTHSDKPSKGSEGDKKSLKESTYYDYTTYTNTVNY